MPNRYLRETILTSDAVDQLGSHAEVFYRRLMSVVDDYGLYDARPLVLKTACYPLRVHKVRETDITRWLAECEKAGLILLYSVDGKPYLQMHKVDKARAKNPKFPLPPQSARTSAQMRADANICAQTRPNSSSIPNAIPNPNSNGARASPGIGSANVPLDEIERAAKAVGDRK